MVVIAVVYIYERRFALCSTLAYTVAKDEVVVRIRESNRIRK